MAHLDRVQGRRRAGPVDPDMQYLPVATIEKFFPRGGGIGDPARPAFRAAGEAEGFMDTRVSDSLRAIGAAELLTAVPMSQRQVIELAIVCGVPSNQVIVDG